MLLEKLEEFKSGCDSALTSLAIFDCAHEFVAKFLALIIPEKVENATETYCGAGFKKNDLLYHCSDCALDETCVMCENCFVYEAHKDHKYWYTVCNESSGGSCDCGEADSWKNDLMCPKHKNCAELQVEAANSTVSPSISATINEFLNFTASTVKDYSSASKNPEKGCNNSLVLYNDERHSFGDVIRILQDELEVDEDLAAAYAELVDKKGFAIVYSSPTLNVLERLSRKVSATGLVTSIESDNMCWNMILSTELMEFLVPLLADHSWLRAIIVGWLLSDAKIQTVVTETNLQLLLLSDHRLWKSFRIHLNDLLNLCNSINQETKKQFATIFCDNYKEIFEAYLKEKREPELSIVRFSVQLFTLIPVAEHCVKSCQILPSIFSKLVDILEPGCGDGGLTFSYLRSIDYGKVNHLIHDALQIMRNLSDSMGEYVMDIGFLEPFIYVIFMFTGVDVHVRKTGEHVEFERNNIDSAQYICFEMQKIAVEICRFAVKGEEIHLIWTLLDKYTGQSPTFQLYQREDKLLVPLYKSKRALSFFGNLSWFWGLLMHTACELGTMKEIHPPSRLMKLFAKDSLTRLIFSAEVRSNLWVRNGSIMALQEYFYSSTVFHHLTYIPDVFNCIILASVMELDPFIKFLLDHSALFAYFEEADQNVAIVEQILVILISSIAANPPLIDADQILINLLCLQDQSRTSLVRSLPDSIADRTDFRQRVFEYASLKVPSTLGSDAVIEIKAPLRSRFDPFFWPMPMDLRMKAWVTMCERKQFSLTAFYSATKERYQPSSGVAVAYRALSGILSNLLLVDSSKFEFAVVATLFCILMLSGDFFDEKEAGVIEKAVLDLKKNSTSTSSLNGLLDEFTKLFSKSVGTQAESDTSGSVEERRSSKPSIADKRSKIMQKFRSQRSDFISESSSEVTSDNLLESGYVCVVCSGTQKEADNDFVLPLQFNKSKLIAGLNGILVRGCCHVFHRKCFEGLRGGLLRKCPLCSAAVDDCVSIVDDLEPLDASFFWSLIDQIDCDSEEEMLAAQAAYSSAFDECPAESSAEALFSLSSSFAYTIACLSSNSSDTVISPQLISTLEAIKKKLIKSNWIGKMAVSDSGSVVEDIQFISSVAFLYFRSVLDSAHAARLIKSVAVKYSSDLPYINQILRFILFDSPLRQEELILIGSSSEFSQKPPSLVPLFPLPDRFDQVLRRYLKAKCTNCDTIPRSPAVCLICGTLVCLNDVCCRDGSGGECRRHRMSCSEDTGIFLLLKNCALLMLSQGSGLIIPAPYLNEFGEHDLDLHSESPLHLNRHLYDKVLVGLWRNGEIRDYIERNQNNSRLVALSWHLL